MRVALRRSLLEDHILQVAAHRSQPTTRYSHDHCKMSHAETLRLLLHLPDGTSWTPWIRVYPMKPTWTVQCGLNPRCRLHTSVWVKLTSYIYKYVLLPTSMLYHQQDCDTTYKHVAFSTRLRYFLQVCVLNKYMLARPITRGCYIGKYTPFRCESTSILCQIKNN